MIKTINKTGAGQSRINGVRGSQIVTNSATGRESPMEELGCDPRSVEPVVTPEHVAVMVDIEALGRKAGCVVTELALVVFDPLEGTVYGERSWVLDHWEQERNFGLEVDVETLVWRKQQGWEPPLDGRKLEEALEELGTFFLEVAAQHGIGLRELQIFGWRYALDKTCLEELFARVEMSCPWEFYQWWCAASICSAAGVKRAGETSHVAVDDCHRQVEALCEAVQVVELGKVLNEHPVPYELINGEGTNEKYRRRTVEAWPCGVRKGHRFQMADGFLTVTDFDWGDMTFVGTMDDGSLGWMPARSPQDVGFIERSKVDGGAA